ncbi:MAG: hypothetical protein M1541_01100 [Acidobacteria bacterium]|nr:hypothetical protein [Acidobacteriota bacterium]
MPDSAHHPAAGHERRDVAVGRLLSFGAGLCFMVLLALVAMRILFGYYSWEQPSGPPPSPLARGLDVPPEPRLQFAEQADLRDERRTEDAILNSYGWVDRKAGVVRIPIDRAMDLLAERGLPAREAKR